MFLCFLIESLSTKMPKCSQKMDKHFLWYYWIRPYGKYCHPLQTQNKQNSPAVCSALNQSSVYACVSVWERVCSDKSASEDNSAQANEKTHKTQLLSADKYGNHPGQVQFNSQLVQWC